MGVITIQVKVATLEQCANIERVSQEQQRGRDGSPRTKTREPAAGSLDSGVRRPRTRLRIRTELASMQMSQAQLMLAADRSNNGRPRRARRDAPFGWTNHLACRRVRALAGDSPLFNFHAASDELWSHAQVLFFL